MPTQAVGHWLILVAIVNAHNQSLVCSKTPDMNTTYFNNSLLQGQRLTTAAGCKRSSRRSLQLPLHTVQRIRIIRHQTCYTRHGLIGITRRAHLHRQTKNSHFKIQAVKHMFAHTSRWPLAHIGCHGKCAQPVTSLLENTRYEHHLL